MSHLDVDDLAPEGRAFGPEGTVSEEEGDVELAGTAAGGGQLLEARQ